MALWDLDILSTSDRAIWNARFEGLADQYWDIHYTADYARIYELTYGQTAYLAVYGDADDYILMPFMLRDVRELPFMLGWPEASPLYDIANPYGYGGPLAHASHPALSQDLYAGFFETFHRYCASHQIVSEFASLHPLLGNHAPLQMGQWVDLTQCKPVVYLDLSAAEAVLWKNMCRGHRSSVNKARRHGVQVVREAVRGEALTRFRALYAETMQRNNASERWLFPESYFSNCADCLGDERLSLFTAQLGETTVAQYLTIHAYGTVYYHFGGSRADYFDLRANNLLMYEIALWAKGQGYRWFHLGGGHQLDDSLYRFKAGFSDNKAWLYTYRRIHMPDDYARLCALRDAWRQARGETSRQSEFFPAYRG